MKKMNKIMVAAVALLFATLALPGYATIVNELSSTEVVNCTGAAHGLWTASDIGGGSCSNYFDIQSGLPLLSSTMKPIQVIGRRFVGYSKKPSG
jgi:hypothetical protein